MRTLEYYDQKLTEIGAKKDPESLKQLLRRNSQVASDSFNDLTPLDATNTRYLLSYKQVFDDGLVIYRATDPTTLASLANSISYEQFDVDDISFVQTQPAAIDSLNGIIQLLTPYDESKESSLIRYMFVNEEAVMNEAIASQALSNLIRKEDRSNVKLTYADPLDVLAKARALQNTSGIDVEEITLTRFACGEVFGEPDA